VCDDFLYSFLSINRLLSQYSTLVKSNFPYEYGGFKPDIGN
jgi:hypothetical protein